jgi:RHS repeat-associated protein
LRTYANGTKAEFSYDEANRLTLLANKKSNNSIISTFEYEYDDAGIRTKRTTPSQALQYTYDNIYEVTEVYQLQPTAATLETFSYDSVGNRTADADYSNYTYNSNNQLTSFDSIALEYDKNGNLTKKTENGTDFTTYSFDYENRLIRIDYPDQTYSEYKYDPSGRRIENRLRDGNIRRYYYDGDDLLAAYDGSNNLLAAAVYGPGIDQAVSVFRDGNNYYYHSDALGNIYQMTNALQNVVKEYDYSAFGKIISESGTLPFDNPITYTGREYDDSGLYYYRARYYDAEVGRFLSRDPIASHNLYRYGSNNPLNMKDALGLCECSAACNKGLAVCLAVGHSACMVICAITCAITAGAGCLVCIAACYIGVPATCAIQYGICKADCKD